MNVYLIKRNKLVHCGFKAKVMGELNVYSACNQVLESEDKVSTGDANEVTCKRCQKKLTESEKKGFITLK